MKITGFNSDIHISGKEGDAIDIQSLLNGAFKFCQQCQLCVLDNYISKWVSDLPTLPVGATVADELHFCSDDCFAQFARVKGIQSAVAKDSAAALPVTGAGAALKKLKAPVKEKAPEPAAPLPVAVPKSLKGVRYKSWTPGGLLLSLACARNSKFGFLLLHLLFFLIC